MTISVVTEDIDVTHPVKLSLIDHSGAHVILTVSIADHAPVTHAFDFNEGELLVPVDLKPGKYGCSFTVQAFKHPSAPNRCSCLLLFKLGQSLGSSQSWDW